MKNVFFLLFTVALIAPRITTAQVNKADIPHFNHAAICVKDLKKSTDFYRSALKLEEIANPFNDGIHAWFSMGPALQLHIIQRGCPLLENKNTHLCFSVASLSGFITHLEKRNVAYTNLKGDSKIPTTRIDGVKQIYLQDPDGYWIEINDAK
ncbi:Glyoxalase/bleomycin resistance protein/dioxygenase [Hymenobacter roseosalivarius DSM 11622]|uniref:Glyoxalase/bleomycin resistance protein/dioxygenase n=1 Tax=Hymenobacter roseosalivarius DSM 11622 TaxID=645990 RepID=A0A1W1V1A2_9BACT|nr:VOC family protein [Hymenobacter roseosalivarius]SMB87096.1 Glyoxalase/bleomycin resistance protein/dioxygenase [Hymenobacter roseosalivarius DSM 11622]